MPNVVHDTEKEAVKSTGNKCRKNVQFSDVVVYSFAREQGFSSIPDTGWCSLGMSRRHFSVSRYDVHYHQLLVRLRRKRRSMPHRNVRWPGNMKHRFQTARQIKERRQEGFLSRVRTNGMLNQISTGDSARVPIFSSPPPLSPQIVSFNDTNLCDMGPPKSSTNFDTPPPRLSPPSPRRVLMHLGESNVSQLTDVLDTDSEASLDQMPAVKSSRTRFNTRKLLPVQGPARIRLLKESGVTRLDESEREICLRIRAARSRVGCDCDSRSPCLPGKCSCIEEGIQCQVDRACFPCCCSSESCQNPNGRTEFSQERVRAHVLSVVNSVNMTSEPENFASTKAIAVQRFSIQPSELQPVEGHCSSVASLDKLHECKQVNQTPTRPRKCNTMKQSPPSSNNPVHSHSRQPAQTWISSTPDCSLPNIRRALFLGGNPSPVTPNCKALPDTDLSVKEVVDIPSSQTNTKPEIIENHEHSKPQTPLNLRSRGNSCSHDSASESRSMAAQLSPDCQIEQKPEATLQKPELRIPSNTEMTSYPVEREIYSTFENFTTPLRKTFGHRRMKFVNATGCNFPLSKAPYQSQSAPNSPAPVAESSLGRLSLRRRAIPRMPLTPGGKMAKLNRSSRWQHSMQPSSPQTTGSAEQPFSHDTNGHPENSSPPSRPTYNIPSVLRQGVRTPLKPSDNNCPSALPDAASFSKS